MRKTRLYGKKKSSTAIGVQSAEKEMQPISRTPEDTKEATPSRIDKRR
jgi:hypothetical protein